MMHITDEPLSVSTGMEDSVSVSGSETKEAMEKRVSKESMDMLLEVGGYVSELLLFFAWGLVG
jgi:hypothetical protein